MTSARRHNAANNVSGYLTLFNDQFLQIIEGEHTLLQDVMQRIATDNRNRAVLVREQSAIDTTMFKDWAMGCSLEPELLRTAMTFAGLSATEDFATASPEALKTFLVMLSNMSDRHRGELAS